MATIKTSGYRLLEPGERELEIVSAAPVYEYDPPELKLELRVAAGEDKGFTFFDYPALDQTGLSR